MTDNVVYLFASMAKPSDTLPNRIREHRLAKKWRLSDLANAIGFGVAMTGHLERGDRPLTLEHLRIMARALGVAVPDLLSPEDNPLSLDQDERRLIGDYRELPVAGRRTVHSVAENLREWGAAPPEAQPEDDRRRA